MKRFRNAVFIIGGVYILITAILMLKEDWVFNQFNLLDLIKYLQIWIVIGLVTIALNILTNVLYSRGLLSKNERLHKDYLAIKAKLYDIEEERRAEVARKKEEEEEVDHKIKAFEQSLYKENSSDSDAPN